MNKYVIMLDGGFVRYKVPPLARPRRHAEVKDVIELCERIQLHPALKDQQLLRIFYYDAPPCTGIVTHPIDGSQTDFSRTPVAIANERLHRGLELQPNFAVRLGRLKNHGWKLGPSYLRKHRRNPTSLLAAKDLVPAIDQKGVDMRIGIDIARTAFRRTAETIVLVTGDSDFITPMKLARIEGLRVYLCIVGHPVDRELKVHADMILF